jgi:hypothetical protein
LAADLDTLDTEDAEPDNDIGGVSDGLGDLLGDVRELGHRLSFLSGDGQGFCGRTRSARPC